MRGRCAAVRCPVRAVLCAAALLAALAPARATNILIDITGVAVTNIYSGGFVAPSTNFYPPVEGGFINGAFYAFFPLGSGSGQFRDLYRLAYSDPKQDTNSVLDPEDGYNHNTSDPNGFKQGGTVNIESFIPNGYDPVITVSNLLAVATNGWVAFSLDANEPNSAPNKFLSLDEFRLYHRPTQAGTPGSETGWPSNTTAITGGTNPPLGSSGPLGTLLYSMNLSGQTNHVLLGDRSSGSGASDLFVYVPVALFTNLPSTNYVYLYTAFGRYNAAGFQPESTPEQWSLAVAPPIEGPLVPEPATVASTLLMLAAAACHRLRRHRAGTPAPGDPR